MIHATDLPENSPVFEVYRSRLLGVKWPLKSLSLYVLKSHESFTYVSPNVFSASFKSMIINTLQEIVRVSFSAPNASQKCGAFLFGGQVPRGRGGGQFTTKLNTVVFRNLHNSQC